VLAFQSADSKLTLEEGLREYYGCRQGLVSGRGLSEAAQKFFRCHDVAHVVFGCSTTLDNEMIVKLWSFFGTTTGLGLLKDYRAPEAKEIYETMCWSEIPGTAMRSLATVPKVAFRCMKMSKRWPWDDYEPYLKTSLSTIREEFRIAVVTVA